MKLERGDGMKRILGICVICIYLPLFWILRAEAGECSETIETVEFEALDAQMMMDVLVTESKAENKSDEGIAIEDAQMLMQIAMAEAEGEGVEGKAMVMAVVLNRVADERFPDNVHDVIFAKGQFSPISDGRYYQVTPDVECHLALAEIECGKYDNIDALYFENATGSWQSEKCEYLYTVGHHRFYRD